MPNKIVFWDWTGTLADESRLDSSICRGMEREIAERDEIPFREAEKRFKAHLKSLENTWQWHDYPLHGSAFGLDWKRHQVENLRELKLLPHAREILEYVRGKGYKNVLATNAVKPVILLRVEHAGIQDLFDLIIGIEEVRALKSEGRHIEKGLRDLHGDPKASFSVGDNPVQDIFPAKRLGLKTIFCDFGGRYLTHYHTDHIAGNHDEPAKADYCIRDLLGIKGVIG